MSTEIQWTWTFHADGSVTKGETWNFLSGCNEVAPECKNCYARTLHDQRHKAYHEGHPLPKQYADPFHTVNHHESRLTIPLSWKKGKRVFVNSMSDTFHKDVPIMVLAQAWATMAVARQHTFLVLTKRIARAHEVLNSRNFQRMVGNLVVKMAKDRESIELGKKLMAGPSAWPLPNVWLGVSAGAQDSARRQIPLLLKTPAAIRFLSAEPLLGFMDIKEYLPQQVGDGEGGVTPFKTTGLDWVIGGGESGGIDKARPTHPDHARRLRDDCVEAGVPFFWKQWGEWTPGENVEDNYEEKGGKYPTKHPWEEDGWTDCSDDWMTEQDHGPIMYRVGKKKAGRHLDGVEWNQYPTPKET